MDMQYRFMCSLLDPLSIYIIALQTSSLGWPCGAGSRTSMPHQKRHGGKSRKVHLLLVFPCSIIWAMCVLDHGTSSYTYISGVGLPNFQPTVLRLLNFLSRASPVLPCFMGRKLQHLSDVQYLHDKRIDFCVCLRKALAPSLVLWLVQHVPAHVRHIRTGTLGD